MSTGGSEEENVLEKEVQSEEEKMSVAATDNVENVETKEGDAVQPETVQEDQEVQAETVQAEAVVENIEATVTPLVPERQVLPKQALVCVGEYPAQILVKGSFLSQKDAVQPVFIDKSSDEILKWGKDVFDEEAVSGLDANVDTQFWFQVMTYVERNEKFVERLKDKLVDNQYGALVVSSAWDGIGSAFLPMLTSRLKEWNMDSVAVALLPSKVQSADASFNALSALGMCFSQESATLILVGRDQLNKYVGVDRNGSVVEGIMVLDTVVEMMLAKKTAVRELAEMSRSFGVKAFTILAATGASFKIYGSLENILDTTLFRSLLSINLSSASLLYVLPRVSVQLKEKLSRDKIELSVANWFKEKVSLESIYITEPLYVEDTTDRVDLIMFVGGFDLKAIVASMEKKGNAIKTQAVKQGSIKEKDWEGIIKSLAKS
jgi:hypothetical protein